MRPFDLVIFDLDGTLVDSAPDIASALNMTLADAGLPMLPVQDVIRFVGDGATKLLERALTAIAAMPGSAAPSAPPAATLLPRFLDTYQAHSCVASRLYPGVDDLLGALHASGTATVVLTNKPDAIARELLAALAVLDRFTAVIGDGAGFPRKPDPAAAHHLISLARATPERTIVVGDGIPDMRMASAVPCASLAAGWGYTTAAALRAEAPRFWADSVPEATRLLTGLGSGAAAAASKD